MADSKRNYMRYEESEWVCVLFKWNGNGIVKSRARVELTSEKWVVLSLSSSLGYEWNYHFCIWIIIYWPKWWGQDGKQPSKQANSHIHSSESNFSVIAEMESNAFWCVLFWCAHSCVCYWRACGSVMMLEWTDERYEKMYLYMRLARAISWPTEKCCH